MTLEDDIRRELGLSKLLAAKTQGVKWSRPTFLDRVTFEVGSTTFEGLIGIRLVAFLGPFSKELGTKVEDISDMNGQTWEVGRPVNYVGIVTTSVDRPFTSIGEKHKLIFSSTPPTQPEEIPRCTGLQAWYRNLLTISQRVRREEFTVCTPF
ncbi:hypothetical protein KAR91_61670 [Candidatus Pacearchaeota archaeon]|nr:hypothetical protein [Candidatus Pacearchaeota archaeon]